MVAQRHRAHGLFGEGDRVAGIGRVALRRGRHGRRQRCHRQGDRIARCRAVGIAHRHGDLLARLGIDGREAVAGRSGSGHDAAIDLPLVAERRRTFGDDTESGRAAIDHGLRDGCGRDLRRDRRDDELRRLARDIAGHIADLHGEDRAAVAQGDARQGQRAAIRTGDRRAIAQPLVSQRLRAQRMHAEAGIGAVRKTGAGRL